MTRRAVVRVVFVAAALLALAGCRASAPTELELEVVRRIDRAVQDTHPRGFFTQGLLHADGRLYESTGGRAADPYGPSRLLEVVVRDDVAHPQRGLELDGRLFGEGLARVGDELVQLTWRAGRAIRWRLGTFERLGEHRYDGEGWGLCFDGERLVMSDGSDRLQFRDPDTFELEGSTQVRLRGEPLPELNELECVDGAVWANVWFDDRIVRIDPEAGRVTGVVDASSLLSSEERATLPDGAVLNGIAWIPERESFVLTGKLWPALFEVRLR